jgi:hypothetical protein
MPLRYWLSVFAILAAIEPVTPAGPGAQAVSHEEARKWGRARVAIDKNAFEKMLAPTLHVQVGGRRLSRQQFIDRISSPPPGVTLTRFDARVLTVAPNGHDWVAIILEKIEFERKDASGRTEKEYWAWVTRDGWRKVAGDSWLILYSEEVSHENWKETPPPLANW